MSSSFGNGGALVGWNVQSAYKTAASAIASAASSWLLEDADTITIEQNILRPRTISYVGMTLKNRARLGHKVIRGALKFPLWSQEIEGWQKRVLGGGSSAQIGVTTAYTHSLFPAVAIVGSGNQLPLTLWRNLDDQIQKIVDVSPTKLEFEFNLPTNYASVTVTFVARDHLDGQTGTFSLPDAAVAILTSAQTAGSVVPYTAVAAPITLFKLTIDSHREEEEAFRLGSILQDKEPIRNSAMEVTGSFTAEYVDVYGTDKAWSDQFVNPTATPSGYKQIVFNAQTGDAGGGNAYQWKMTCPNIRIEKAPIQIRKAGRTMLELPFVADSTEAGTALGGGVFPTTAGADMVKLELVNKRTTIL